MPRQPIGTTFVVAISLLGAVALIQLLAVAWHYIPLVRQQIAKTSESQATPPQAAQTPGQQTQQPSLPPAEMRKVQQLIADADRNSRVGDFEAAMNSLKELEKLLPGDPSVLLRKALVFERLEQPADAALLLEEILKYPGLPQEIHSQAQTKLDQLAQVLASRESPSGDAAAPSIPQAAGADIRDDIGLQPGASLGVVDARLRDAKPGIKSLRLAVKSRPGSTINVQDVKIHVYFYEQNEEEDVVLTESKVVPQWLSPPVDWTSNEPELLEVQYTLPDSGLPGSAAANGAPGRKYFGYIVGVFYNNELQDFRSDPASLSKDFPLQLYLKEGGE
jgi:hypothetical protein